MISHEELSRRAHQIWEESGRAHGNDTAHWLQAERELHELQAGTGAKVGPQHRSTEPGAAAKHVPEKAQHSTDYVHPGVTTDSLHHHRNRTAQPR